MLLSLKRCFDHCRLVPSLQQRSNRLAILHWTCRTCDYLTFVFLRLFYCLVVLWRGSAVKFDCARGILGGCLAWSRYTFHVAACLATCGRCPPNLAELRHYRDWLLVVEVVILGLLKELLDFSEVLFYLDSAEMASKGSSLVAEGCTEVYSAENWSLVPCWDDRGQDGTTAVEGCLLENWLGRVSRTHARGLEMASFWLTRCVRLVLR